MCALWSRDADDAKRRQQVILDLLEDIRDQRAKIKLEFDEGVTSIKDLTATLLEYDASGMTVEVSSLKNTTHAFDGAHLSCFFRVRDREARGREQYLTFDTSVRTVEQRPSGSVHFILAFPQNLKSAQLRRSVRVKVDGRKVPELTLWPDFSGWQDMSKLTALLGPEQLAAREFKVDNFSANGLRLLVDSVLIHAVMPEPVKGTRYAVHFEAVAEPGAQPASFWVQAVLRNVFRDPQTGETALGFEFVAEGSMDEKHGLVWRPLRFDEVSGLGKFVFKWNLDLYREKGMGS
ncbi:PilZ domain-containing protein [Humidesulfovibrio sp.]